MNTIASRTQGFWPVRTVCSASMPRHARKPLHRELLEAIAAGFRLPDLSMIIGQRLQLLLPHARCEIFSMQAGQVALAWPAASAFDLDVAARGIGHAARATTAEVRYHPGPTSQETDFPVSWLCLVPGPGYKQVGAFAIRLRAHREPNRRENAVLQRCILLFALAARHEANIRDLEQSKDRLDAALTNVRQGLCFFDRDRRLIVANGRYSDIYHISPGLVRPGMSLQEIVDLRFEAGTGPRISREDYLVWRDTVQSSDRSSDTIVELADGRSVSVHHRPMLDGGWVATHEDVTERLAAEASIRHLASHDPLTGLANRMLFRVRLEQALADAPPGRNCAVLCLDLDRFKSVNDTYGHPVGDQLLVVVAERLRSCVRENDTITRLGGDEFAILLANHPAADLVMTVASRVLAALHEPYVIDGHCLSIGTSLGAACGPEAGNTPELILQHADLALYRAKREQRGTLCIFKPQMVTQLEFRTRREAELRQALTAGEFELDYQPMVDVRTRILVGFEALIRWRHPTEGRIPPGDFISIAEETGLIAPIGAWVLREACTAAAAWPRPVQLAVNLSAVQFRHPGLPAAIADALAGSGIDPNRLEVEITESVLLQDTSAMIELLHGFRRRGVRVALDDFGTGQSSLSHVQAFPFDKIKIDKSFVQNMTERRESLAVVRAVAGLGNSLQVKTTAEGVETERQFATIEQEGCTEAQGYLFGGPMSGDAVASFMLRTT